MRYHGSMDAIDYRAREHSYISRVYGWMCAALIISGIVAMYTVSTGMYYYLVMPQYQMVFLGLIILEFVMVIALGRFINKMRYSTAALVFIAFSVLNGVVISAIIAAFTANSVASAFFACAATFAIMSMIGWYTKKDLTSIGNICFMGLIGIIVASLVNMFWANNALYWIINYIGVLIFVGLIAYDTQKIKKMGAFYEANSDAAKKSALLGALSLYLDFINLFIFLLNILGNRR